MGFIFVYCEFFLFWCLGFFLLVLIFLAWCLKRTKSYSSASVLLNCITFEYFRYFQASRKDGKKYLKEQTLKFDQTL